MNVLRFKRITNPSRSLLDQALKIYSDRDYYNPEKARVLYKRGKLSKSKYKSGNSGSKDLAAALLLYRTLKPGDTRPIEELKDEDFDDCIVFWSK